MDAATLQQHWSELLQGHRVQVGLADGDDERVIVAGSRLADEDLICPVLIGDPEIIRAKAAAAGVRLPDQAIRSVAHTLEPPAVRDALERGLANRPDELAAAQHDPLWVAAGALSAGAIDACLAGAGRPTADVLRAGLRVVGLRPDIRVLSSAFLILPPGGRVLTFSDCAVVPDPDADQLVDIGIAAALTHKQLTGEQPLVAMLSFSTHGSADHPNVAKVRTAAERSRASAGDLVVDGELQFDAAVVDSVGEFKAPGSPVAGRANVLIFPNLDAGNIGYKIAERIGGAIALGPILQGLRAPINDLSRGCSVSDIETMARLTAVQSLLSRAPGTG